MRLSTRGRYAVRSLIDLTMNSGQGYISLQSISERQDISLHYLEQIFHKLKKAGIVQSKKGLGGGYVLASAPDNISIGDIIRAVEGPISPVRCVSPETNKEKCARSNTCVARVLWQELEQKMESFLDDVNLENMKTQALKMPCEV